MMLWSVAALALCTSASPPVVDLRLRAGIAGFSLTHDDRGPGFALKGLTPLDLELGGAVRFGMLGFRLLASHQRFSITEPERHEQLRGLATSQLSLGPQISTHRDRWEGWASLGYAFAQIPALASSLSPVLIYAPGTRHALYVSGAIRFSLPAHWKLGLRAELPVVGNTTSALGGDAKSSGVKVGASIGYPLPPWGPWALEAALEGDGAYERLEFRDGAGALVKSRLGTLRGGLALRGTWSRPQPVLVPVPPPIPPTPPQEPPPEAPPQVKAAGLKVTVRDAATQLPLSGAEVHLRGSPYFANEQGEVLLEDLPPGPADLTAQAEGYRTEHSTVEILRGQETPVDLSLRRSEQALVLLTGTVTDAVSGRPVKARLQLAKLAAFTESNEDGSFRLQLGRGTYQLVFTAPGYAVKKRKLVVDGSGDNVINVQLIPRR